MSYGPREIFHGLGCLLASLSGGVSKPLKLLQRKMAASSVPFLPIPRFVEIPDDDPDSNEINSVPSSGELAYVVPSSTWIPQLSSTAVHGGNESTDSAAIGSNEQTLASQIGIFALPVTNHHQSRAPTTVWTSFV